MRIFVTGMGITTAIGNNVRENLRALEEGTTGIALSEDFGLMLAKIDIANEEIIQRYDLPEADYSRTSLLGMIAAKEAWGKNEQHSEIRTGLISATSVGGMNKVGRYYFQNQEKGIDTYALMTYDNGRTTERIARELGITGYVGTISTACSSGANAIMQGARLIRAGRLDRMIVGGSDPLSEYNIKGFHSLGIYSDELCQPFDDKRKGLNLGEGSAFLVLENEYSISKTGNPPLCLLTGWNNSSDAFHQTASSANGKGATLAMNLTLEKAKLSTEDISYINTHGTGTQNNDLSESMALKNVFGNRIPPFSSTKGFTGHTLAAAGAIEAVYSILSILSDAVLPNLHFSTAIKETGLLPETSFQKGMDIRHALSNSFGFGGNCTSLIFSKIV